MLYSGIGAAVVTNEVTSETTADKKASQSVPLRSAWLIAGAIFASSRALSCSRQLTKIVRGRTCPQSLRLRHSGEILDRSDRFAGAEVHAARRLIHPTSRRTQDA